MRQKSNTSNCTVIKLILVMPATNAVNEGSFSSLRRVETYFRATMTQDRLNHLMVFHVHKDLTDKLNLNDIGNEFVGQSEHRLALFGSFSEKRKIGALRICNFHSWGRF